MKINIGEMTIGDILERGMKLLFSRIFVLYAIELIVLSPVLIMQLLLPDFMVSPGGAMILVIPMIVLGPIGSAAMLRVITQEFQGNPVGIGEAFLFALGRFGPLLLTSILVGLGVGLGMILCCVPGLYLAVLWAFISQVVVVENIWGPAALTRSSELVQGYFWRVAVTIFALGFCIALIAGAVSVGLASALPHQEIVEMPNPQAGKFFPVMRVNNYLNYAIVTVIPTLVNILGQTYTAICMTLIYFDLRHRKDRYDLFRDERLGGTWRDEADDMPPPLPGSDAPQTGIKSDDAAPPKDTGIQPDDDRPRP